ncbi:hypothetical protein [Sphingopyxis sp.]|uniref:phage fiber-tail adaptor protein n=1 Tax=Sphingopyxis sp. TaxID=1908224 RepID=UPI003D14A16D
MTMMLKDPGSRIDHAFEWSTAYPDGQTIMASAWSVVPDEADGLTVAAAGHGLTDAAATLTGGIAGHVYRVTNRVTMGDGQIDERSISVRVEER